MLLDSENVFGYRKDEKKFPVFCWFYKSIFPLARDYVDRVQ